ncbi:MAG: hypothetical protein FD179_1829 [Erysipelotrichaceae bacterium]|nr:MAG: hypothetical protein FD179_1829 [Erysipelotrichaceae bacterium]
MNTHEPTQHNRLWLQRVLAFEQTMNTWGNELFKIPELGFKEIKTREKILSYAKTFGLKLHQDFGVNGFSIQIGEGHPHIGLVAELDALVVPNHPTASIDDHAAHSCGHHLQSVIMLSALGLYNQYRDPKLKGTITLFCVAAEEYINLDYRKTLRDEGKITLYSGKQNLLIENAFKDVDLILSAHTMGSTDQPMIELNSRLSGFIYKKIHFKGLSSHAAVAPHLGINALNAMNLTQNAIAFLRESFEEKDMVRVHLMSSLGGQSVNTVPSHTILEGYVRSINPDSLKQINERINTASHHSALALAASADIEDTPGYLPLIQDELINEVLRPHAEALVGKQGILDHQLSFASGDIGDLSMFKPTIQFGFSGCSGRIHGDDFKMSSSQEALVNPVALCLSVFDDLFHDPSKVTKITQHFKPKITLDDFKKLHKL